jgi:hypothetical protein
LGGFQFSGQSALFEAQAWKIDLENSKYYSSDTKVNIPGIDRKSSLCGFIQVEICPTMG